MVEEWTPIVVVTAIASFSILVSISYFYFKSKNRQATQETLRAALERGETLTPELVVAISSEHSSSVTDFRRGTLMIALALGIAALGTFVDPGEPSFFGMASVPALLGLGYLVMWRFGPKA